MVPIICVHDSHMKVWQFWLHQSSENIWGHFGNLFKIWAATWQNQQSHCVPIEDSDQPGHPPSLIRVFAVRMKKTWVLSYPLSAQRRLWSDWVDAQADLSLHWAHSHFVGFVMSWLIFTCTPSYALWNHHCLASTTSNLHFLTFENTYGITIF